MLFLLLPPPRSTLFPYTTLFRSIQFVDVFPKTPDRRVQLFPAALDASAPIGLYRFQPDPATDRYPLALIRSEEHTSELQSLRHLVCRLLLEKKKNKHTFNRSQTS